MHSILESKRAHRRAMHARHLVFKTLFFVVLGIGIVSTFLLAPVFRIREIIISGVESPKSETIERFLQRLLDERVFGGMVSRAHLLFLESDYVQQRLSQTFPHIASADVSRSLRGVLHIVVQERTTWGMYCGREDAACYYISDDGVLFAKAPELTGDIIFRVRDDRPRGSISLGNSPLERDYVDSIRKLRDIFPSYLTTEVKEVVIGLEEDGSLRAYTDEGWYILFDTTTNIEKALQDLKLVLEQQVARRENLEYADIRFEGKIFYKRRD